MDRRYILQGLWKEVARTSEDIEYGCCNFTAKVMLFIDGIVPIKNRRGQDNSEEWFGKKNAE